MVLDTSAILAILLQEPAPRRSIVMEARQGPAGGRELDLLVHRAGGEVVPFTSEQAEAARQAWRRFGKGRPEGK